MSLLIERVEQKVKEIMAKAGELFGVKFPPLRIKFDLKGSNAGMAYPASYKLRFNYGLLERNIETFIGQTVPHECAHIITSFAYDKPTAHGPEWRSVMVKLGVEPKRCHNYEIKGIQVRKHKKFSYQCGCKEHLVSTNLNNKMVAGRVYKCQACKGSLIPINKTISMGQRKTLNFTVD